MQQNLGLSYDSADRMTGLVNTAYTAVSQNFGYDALDRLTGMSGPAPLTLAYDPNGNRLQQNGPTNDMVNVDGGSNRILSRGAHSYTYDANGNRVTDNVGGSTLTYAYDGFNRLRAASRNTAASICETNGTCPTYPAGNMTYVVDAEGRREAKTDPNGETAWYNYLPNGQPSAELSNKRGFNYYIYLGNQPIAVVHNPLVYDVNLLYYIHADQLGRPEIITDSSQNKVWQGLNFAFDRSMLIENVSGIDIGLPGQIYDQETGHWNNGFRDYDSSSGRYLESDPMGLAGGINTYAYVGNNPLINIDPDGRQIAGTVNNNNVNWSARAQDNAEIIGYLLTGTNIDQMNPPGDDSIQSVVTPFEFMAASGVARGIGAASEAMCESKVSSALFSTYDASITSPGSRYLNIQTNVTATDFQSNLASNGYGVASQGVGANGPFTVMNNGKSIYTIYTRTSTGSAGAQYVGPNGVGAKFSLGGQ